MEIRSNIHSVLSILLTALMGVAVTMGQEGWEGEEYRVQDQHMLNVMNLDAEVCVLL